MITLGIEGTAHTLGVGIVDSDAKVLANVINMFRPPQGGLHPREAANHHADVVADTISQAVQDAGISFKDVDLVSFSMGPHWAGWKFKGVNTPPPQTPSELGEKELVVHV